MWSFDNRAAQLFFHSLNKRGKISRVQQVYLFTQSFAYSLILLVSLSYQVNIFENLVVVMIMWHGQDPAGKPWGKVFGVDDPLGAASLVVTLYFPRRVGPISG